MLNNIPKELWYLAVDVEDWSCHYAWIGQLQSAEHQRKIGMSEENIIKLHKRALRLIRGGRR